MKDQIPRKLHKLLFRIKLSDWNRIYLSKLLKYMLLMNLNQPQYKHHAMVYYRNLCYFILYLRTTKFTPATEHLKVIYDYKNITVLLFVGLYFSTYN